MTINHNNIDKWLFEYFEGNLSASEKRQVNAFIQAYPEYREDFAAWQESFVNDTVPEFAGADALMVKTTETSYSRLALVLLLLLFVTGTSAWFIFGPNQEDTYADGTSSVKQKSIQPVAGVQSSEVSFFTKKSSEQVAYTPIQPALSFRDVPANTYYSPLIPESNYSAVNHHPSVNAMIISPLQIQNHIGRQPLAGIPVKNQTVPAQSNNNSKNNFSASDIPQNKANQPRTNADNGTNTNAESNQNQNNNVNEHPEYKIAEYPMQYMPLNDITDELVINHSGQEGESILLSADDDSAVKAEKDVTSEMNPDLRASNLKSEDNKKDLPEDEESKNHLNINSGKLKLINKRDPLVLQPVSYNFTYNPAFIGTSATSELLAAGRYHLGGSQQQSGHMLLGYQNYLRKIKTGFAVIGNYSTYVDGKVKISGLTMAASHKIKVDRYTSVEPGLSISLNNNTISKGIGNQPISFETRQSIVYNTEVNSSTPVSRTYLNLQAGVLMNFKHCYGSLGVSNVLQPDMSYLNTDAVNKFRLPLRLDLMVGTDMQSVKYSLLSFSPQISFVGMDNYYRAWVGGSCRYDKWSLGASVSSGKEVLAVAGFNSKHMKLTYKFDLSQSQVLEIYRPSHELSVNMYIKSMNKKQTEILNY